MNQSHTFAGSSWGDYYTQLALAKTLVCNPVNLFPACSNRISGFEDKPLLKILNIIMAEIGIRPKL